MTLLKEITDIENGTKFVRADLHIHSYGDEGSYDVTDDTMTPENIIDTAISKGLKIISITDHNSIGNVKKAITYSEDKGILVIPGIEISTIQGHLLLYFPTYSDLSIFFGKLTIAPNKETCDQGICECLTYAEQNNGIGVLAHIELTSGFEQTIGRFGPPIEKIFKHQNLFGLEISKKESNIFYTELDINAERKDLIRLRRKELKLPANYNIAKLMSSDSHTLAKLGLNADGNERLTRIKIDELSFDSFKIALINNKSRIKIEDFIPETIPRFIGIKLEGGLLDGQIVHFNNNLTCIIGGRGTGKSTLLESVRECSGNGEEASIVDSDVWADKISLVYEDETGKQITLIREKNGEIKNITDPNGLTKIQIESYGQGKTAETIQHSGNSPKVLLDFLDGFIDLKMLVDDDKRIKDLLLGNQSLLKQYRLEIKQIPDIEKEINDLKSKVVQLEKDKVGDLVKYHLSLQAGETFRKDLVDELNRMAQTYREVFKDKTSLEAILSLKDEELIVGKENFTKIKELVNNFSELIDATETKLNTDLNTKIEEIKIELKEWRTQETKIYEEIDKQKATLEANGIPFDIGKINQIIKDLAHYEGKLKVLLQTKKFLTDAEKERNDLIKQRKETKNRIFLLRNNLGRELTENLKDTIEDFNVSIKYEEGRYSNDFEKSLKDSLEYRTASVNKAKIISDNISPLEFVEKLNNGLLPDFLRGLERDGNKVFDEPEIARIENTFKEGNLYEDLESLEFEDKPKIIVTRETTNSSRPLIKPLHKLSLGQQQSILLAILLHSKNNYPLIIDQPEDNLDSAFIYKTIVSNLETIKEKRQVIIVTHNANIPVLGDAELIIPLKGTDSKAIIVDRGSIDKENIQKLSCEILEGGELAFRKRREIYGI